MYAIDSKSILKMMELNFQQIKIQIPLWRPNKTLNHKITNF